MDEHARADPYGGGEVAQRDHDLAALKKVSGRPLHDRVTALVVDTTRQGRYCNAVTLFKKEGVMPSVQREELLRSLYEAFNARDVDTCLGAMTPDVDWANGWEGGRVVGRDAVRDYWKRQWAAIDSSAEPTAITARSDGSIEVAVHLVARDHEGEVLSDTEGRHVYEFRGDLVERMTIEE
jgi:hypothetical protein